MRPLRPFLLLVTVLAALSVRATHNRAGEIVYCADPNNPLRYYVQIITHTKTSAPADRPELAIFWGDGTMDTLARTSNTPIPGADAQRNVYDGVHVYNGPGQYILSIEDQNRNEGVLNIPNSVNQTFCVKSMLTIGPLTGGNCSVNFLNSPLQNACLNTLWMHNSVAYDSDGDSLSYELLTCAGMGCDPIAGYQFPDQVSPAPDVFQIDGATGTLSWDSPQLTGEYNIAFRVREWRKVNGTVFEVGWVVRDMQITVGPCSNLPPVVQPVADTCVTAGTVLMVNVHASDPDPAQNVTLAALGGPMVLQQGPATFLTAGPGNPANGVFTWATACAHVRLQPYQVVFRASDNGSPVVLEDYEPMSITVVAPRPENPTAVPGVSAIQVGWDASVCTNAAGYRIYRRAGPFPFTPAHCETGVPAYTGYQLIGSVAGSGTTAYLDGQVLFGTEYCYRVTAYFNDGAESYSSEEACTMLRRTVPLITKVSVGATDGTAGRDTVQWTNAPDLDTVAHPGPYLFQVFRGDGFGPANTLVHTTGAHPFLMHPDTAFTDDGLNTVGQPHTYRVELWGAGGAVRIGSSNAASSVFLSPDPDDERIQLTWQAAVPWANTSYAVDRFDGVQWTQVAVTTEPQYLDTGLVNGLTYCYRVRTSGAYADPSVAAPLINFSQEACAVPVDLTPPCAPTPTLQSDCQALVNRLSWTNPNNSCADDTWYYTVWFTDSLGGTLVPIATVTGATDTTFTHVNGNSVAGCYAVTATDSVGNESLLSDTLCADNCPLYTLPNVFTPNSDRTNDLFIPFPYRGVKRIDLQVFSRWGNTVFTTEDPAIGWNGTDQKSGKPCPDGVYFYVCTVTFARLNGPEQVQLTGYVHILRGRGSNVQ